MAGTALKRSSSLRATWPDGRKIRRDASLYRQFLTGPDCPWCNLPLSGRTQIDHDHDCCDDGAGTCCAGCVRGLVHQHCNQEIARVDQLRKAGFSVACPTERQEDYFSHRPIMVVIARLAAA